MSPEDKCKNHLFVQGQIAWLVDTIKKKFGMLNSSAEQNQCFGSGRTLNTWIRIRPFFAFNNFNNLVRSK